MSSADPSSRRLGLRSAVAEGLSLAAYLSVKFVTDLLIFVGGGAYLPLDQAGGGIGTDPGLPVGTDLPLPVTVGALILALAVTVVVNMPLTIIAIRTFVVGATDRIPDDALFHRLGRATLSALLAAAGVVVAVAVLLAGGAVAVFVFLGGSGETPSPLSVGIGFAILAGIGATFVGLWVQFVFVPHGIAVRDRGAVGAARESWAIVRGHRRRLLVLGLATLTVVTGEIATLTLGEPIDPALLAALFVEATLSGVVFVVGTAVFAVAYRDLSSDEFIRGGRIGS